MGHLDLLESRESRVGSCKYQHLSYSSGVETYLIETTTTSSCSAILAPLYAGIDELPPWKPPPKIHSMTAFFASPVCGLVQTFKYKQSSLYTAAVLLNTSRTEAPAAVIFAASRELSDRVELFELLTGHEGPCDQLVRGFMRTGSLKTHEICSIEWCSAREVHWRREPKVSSRRLSKGNSKIFGNLRIIGGWMSRNRATICLNCLPHSPIGLSFLQNLKPRCAGRGCGANDEEGGGFHLQSHYLASIQKLEALKEEGKEQEKRRHKLVGVAVVFPLVPQYHLVTRLHI